MREVLQIKVQGASVMGTYHRPAGAETSDVEGVGVLLFNSGYLPRSAGGDLNAQLADQLANLGYQVFRFDMPGLGDTPGDLQTHVVPFFRFVAEGGHAAYGVELVGRLKKQFGLQGLVLMGNCGGAVTAIYTANRARGDVLGVIQLDPDFDIAGSEEMRCGGPNGVSDRAKTFAKTMRQTVRNGLLQTPFGHRIRALYLPVSRGLRVGGRRVWERFFGPRLPERANVPLLHNWEELADAEVPMLVLMADKSKANPGRYDYLHHLLRKRPRSATCFEIPGTNHSFAAGGGKEAVTRHVEMWLKRNTVQRPF
jgi:pimeloyl-ACP methyl ester carboxylesterase